MADNYNNGPANKPPEAKLTTPSSSSNSDSGSSGLSDRERNAIQIAKATGYKGEIGDVARVAEAKSSSSRSSSGSGGLSSSQNQLTEREKNILQLSAASGGKGEIGELARDIEIKSRGYAYDANKQTLQIGDKIYTGVESITSAPTGLKNVTVTQSGNKVTFNPFTGNVEEIQGKGVYYNAEQGKAFYIKDNKLLNPLRETDFNALTQLGVNVSIPKESKGATDYYYKQVEQQGKITAENAAYRIAGSLNTRVPIIQVQQKEGGYIVRINPDSQINENYINAFEKQINTSKSFYPDAKFEKIDNKTYFVSSKSSTDPQYLLSKAFKGDLPKSINVSSSLEPIFEFEGSKLKTYSQLTPIQKEAVNATYLSSVQSTGGSLDKAVLKSTIPKVTELKSYLPALSKPQQTQQLLSVRGDETSERIAATNQFYGPLIEQTKAEINKYPVAPTEQFTLTNIGSDVRGGSAGLQLSAVGSITGVPLTSLSGKVGTALAEGKFYADYFASEPLNKLGSVVNPFLTSVNIQLEGRTKEDLKADLIKIKAEKQLQESEDVLSKRKAFFTAETGIKTGDFSKALYGSYQIVETPLAFATAPYIAEVGAIKLGSLPKIFSSGTGTVISNAVKTGLITGGLNVALSEASKVTSSPTYRPFSNPTETAKEFGSGFVGGAVFGVAEGALTPALKVIPGEGFLGLGKQLSRGAVAGGISGGATSATEDVIGGKPISGEKLKQALISGAAVGSGFEAVGAIKSQVNLVTPEFQFKPFSGTQPTSYKGAVLEVGGKGYPIAGYQSDTGFILGGPRIKPQTVGELGIVAGYNKGGQPILSYPITPGETAIANKPFQEYAQKLKMLTPEERELAKRASSKYAQGYKSKNNYLLEEYANPEYAQTRYQSGRKLLDFIYKGSEPTSTQVSFKDVLSESPLFKRPGAAQKVISLLEEENANVIIYGSGVQKAFLGEAMSRTPKDVDLFVTSGSPEKFAVKTVQKLKPIYGEDIRVSPESPSLVEIKSPESGKFIHGFDVHSKFGDISASAKQERPLSTEFIGYGYKVKAPVKSKEGFNIIPLSEQGTRKGVPVLSPRAFGFAPEPHRFKDIIDFLEVGEFKASLTKNEAALKSLQEFKGTVPEKIFTEFGGPKYSLGKGLKTEAKEALLVEVRSPYTYKQSSSVAPSTTISSLKLGTTNSTLKSSPYLSSSVRSTPTLYSSTSSSSLSPKTKTISSPLPSPTLTSPKISPIPYSYTYSGNSPSPNLSPSPSPGLLKSPKISPYSTPKYNYDYSYGYSSPPPTSYSYKYAASPSYKYNYGYNSRYSYSYGIKPSLPPLTSLTSRKKESAPLGNKKQKRKVKLSILVDTRTDKSSLYADLISVTKSELLYGVGRGTSPSLLKRGGLKEYSGLTRVPTVELINKKAPTTEISKLLNLSPESSFVKRRKR